jgi:hypothetical protein
MEQCKRNVTKETLCPYRRKKYFMSKLLSILISFLFINQYNAQIQIVDSVTSAGIPYAHIRVVGKKERAISDYNGYFTLDSTFKINDSIRILCTGYQSKIVALNSMAHSDRIILTPEFHELEDVLITKKKGFYQLRELGITKGPKTQFFDYSVTAINGTIRAVYMPNEYSLSGVLKFVNVFVTKNGYPDAHFRIHIYSVSHLAIKPGKELTSSNIISSGTTGNEWIKIDLTSERILIPENGCFVGIEWFDHPKSTYFQDTLRYKGVTQVDNKRRDTIYTNIRKGNGIVLGSRTECYKFAKNKLWYKTLLSDGWVNWCTSTTNESSFNIPDTVPSGHIFIRNEHNVFYAVPCINVEVSFSKEKIDLKYDDPKKRKLNKLERVKEDVFIYPQSSILELLSSLIKAVVNDDIIYILKYLCVYDDDELNDILSTMKNNEDSKGIYFSDSDKEKIINHFTIIINNLGEDSIVKLDHHHYELKVNSNRYNLVVDNGKWKINPYTYRIME